jgi:hypothetical protein
MLVNASTAPELSPAQQRFLDTYRLPECGLAIAAAARRAGVHRAMVYRWLADAAFVAAKEAAAEAFFREVRAKVMVQEQAREQWRRQRKRERRRMRCYYLALAREAKRRKRQSRIQDALDRLREARRTRNDQEQE